VILGFGNNVQGALAANITASQTVIPVFPGTGSIFAATLTYDPIIPSGISGSVPIYSKITIADQQETTFEICHLISVSGDNLTVIRGMEGTTAKGWALNSIVANFATRGSENRLVQIEEIQRGFYLSSAATGTANGLVISLPSTLGENSVSAATANFHAPVLITPAATNTGSVTISASVGLLAFPTNAPLLKGNGSQFAAGDIQAGIPFMAVWSESAQSWYQANVPDLSAYATKLNVQSGALSYAVDSGTANAYVCAFTPALVSRSEAAPLRFKVNVTNTGASTINDGLGVVALVGGSNLPLQGGELFATGDAWVQWNSSIGGGSYVLLFCTGAPEQMAPATQSLHAVNAGQIQTEALAYAADTGTANTYVCAFTPAITALKDGLTLKFKAATANTGASVFSPNGLAGLQILGGGYAALQGGEIIAGSEVSLQYNSTVGGGCWVIIASSGGAFPVAPATQSRQAINAGQFQAGTLAFATDTGTVNTYVCAFTPAITTRAEGQVLRFKVKTANNGASTINDGLGVVQLAGAAHAALQGGELIANGDAWIQWNSSVGSGSYILLFCTGAAEQIAAAMRSQQALQFGQVSGIAGQVRNLRISVSTASATASMSADEVIVETGLGGLRYCISSFSNTIGLATTGPGGMDVGSAPANGYVALYVIYNPTTLSAVLLATNATSTAATSVYTGANMPSGYTASGLVSVLPTNGSGQFKVIYQNDRSIGIVPVQVFSGVSGGLVLSPVPLSSAVPLNAVRASGGMTNSSTAVSNCGITINSTTTSIGSQNVSGTVSAGGALNGNYSIDIATPQTLYVSTSNTAGSPTFTASIVGYSI